MNSIIRVVCGRVDYLCIASACHMRHSHESLVQLTQIIAGTRLFLRTGGLLKCTTQIRVASSDDNSYLGAVMTGFTAVLRWTLHACISEAVFPQKRYLRRTVSIKHVGTMPGHCLRHVQRQLP